MSRTSTVCLSLLLAALFAGGGCAGMNSKADTLEQQLAEAKSENRKVRSELSDTKEQLYTTHDNWWHLVLELGAVRKAAAQEKSALNARLQKVTNRVEELEDQVTDLKGELQDAQGTATQSRTEAKGLQDANSALKSENERLKRLVNTQQSQISGLEKELRPLRLEAAALRKQLAEAGQTQNEQ